MTLNEQFSDYITIKNLVPKFFKFEIGKLYLIVFFLIKKFKKLSRRLIIQNLKVL